MHIEIVSDLKTTGFLATFRRFVTRRGLCKVVYSDNGSNFVLASIELQNILAKNFSHE